MSLRHLKERLRAAWRAFSGGQTPVQTMGYHFEEPPPQRDGGLPPGVEPVIVRSEEAEVVGAPYLHFVRTETTLRDKNNAKYTKKTTRPLILPGCGCMISGPAEVAYLSDLSGLPVCRRCASTCTCGHKVAPRERVRVADRTTICAVCYETACKQERRQRLIRFFIGPFVQG